MYLVEVTHEDDKLNLLLLILVNAHVDITRIKIKHLVIVNLYTYLRHFKEFFLKEKRRKKK